MSTIIRNAPSPQLRRLQNLAKRGFAAVAGAGAFVAMMAVQDFDVQDAQAKETPGYSRSTENYLLRQGCDVAPLRQGKPAVCPDEAVPE